MIRDYRESDVEGVLDVWYRASQVAHPFLSEDFLDRERERIRSQHMPMARSWVFEEDGRVVGFIALLGSEVGAVFVDPNRHGRGIGTALVDVASELHETLELEVFEANTLGRAFYARYGFVPVGRHVHAETGQPALRLRYSRDADGER